MNTVAADEAQERFRQLLDEVENGATITIVEDGVPVARLVPPEDRRPHEPASKVGEAIDEFLMFRRTHAIRLGGDLTIRDLIEDGRM